MGKGYKKFGWSARAAFFAAFLCLLSPDFFALAAVLPNDPGITSNSLDVDKQWGLVKAGFTEAWHSGTGSKDIVVAVIDTGIDATHEDLQNIQFVKGFNFLARQEIINRTNSDDNGHGTLVAGILGASQNNGLGVAGANWQISLMPLKALDGSGKGDVSMISEAIVWAADHGAHIINLSIGGIGLGHDTVLANAVSYAFSKGLVIVAAAGNDAATEGHSLDEQAVFPICDDNGQNMIIGVAAVDQNDVKPSFSNYGKNCIDVVAPGKRILSTINHDPITKKYAPNSYAYASGTSLAVPYVVGQAALLKSAYPYASNVQIRDKILSTADPVDNLNLAQCGGKSCQGLLGAGRINAAKSLAAPLLASDLKEGELVRIENSQMIYKIAGGKKLPISPFVMNRQYLDAPVKTLPPEQLAGYPEGPYLAPKDGTLIKLAAQPTVYYINAGQKMPVTYAVFAQRKLDFKEVNTVDYPEFNSWVTGSFLPPSEGSIVKTPKSPTIYWVVSGVLHPMNYAFFVDRGLNASSPVLISDKDLEKMPKGPSFIR